MSTSSTEELTTTVVRKILKDAGLAPAKRDVSSNVRQTHGMGGNYVTIRIAGFALKHQTEYRMKRHERTGRVEVEMLLNSWRPDQDQANQDMAIAISALQDAGLTAVRADVPNRIVVSR